MNETRKPRHKLILFIFAVILCIAVLAFPYINEYTDAASDGGTPVTITVPRGASATYVAELLEDKGLIKSKYTFLLKFKLNRDVYTDIYPGDFELNSGMCLSDILKKLTTEYDHGETVTITIPEGFSIEMIAKRLANNSLCSEEAFISAVDNGAYDYEFIKHIPDGGYRHRLEGFLFPSTYEFFKSATAEEIIDKMLSAFEEAYLSEFDSYDNLFTNMTIASLIEREAAAESERGTISGVIKNRLALPMKLQLDASAVYAKTNGLYDIETPSGEDVKFNSPYNTYICDALPPGPICCPGIASLKAAANPENHNYLYYHTDTSKNDGSHIFTETYEEHMAGL